MRDAVRLPGGCAMFEKHAGAAAVRRVFTGCMSLEVEWNCSANENATRIIWN